MATESQAKEGRSERSAVAVTPTEKDALKLVVAFDQTTESDLLRDSTIAEVMARARQIREFQREYQARQPVEAAS